MPPIRTVSTSKPMKTERTHEENQERAYIAASRRSDRSLEARIESARRASEIHKKRTGRALRVTEQDVVNEEMYEEEDDDLPAQIRRLQSFAHLQTGNMEFNRRLQAYMSSQLGTRSALMDQGNFVQPYSNAPFFANQFGQPQQQPTMLPPQLLHTATPGMRYSPYPMSPQGFGQAMHHRSTSLSNMQNPGLMHSNPTSPALAHFSEDQRRMSLPPQQQSPPTPVSQAQTPTMRPPMLRTTSKSAADGESASQAIYHKMPDQGSESGAATPNLPVSAESFLDASPHSVNFAPFSTSLPPETQQLLVQPQLMDSQSSFNPYWMHGNSSLFSYSYKPNAHSSSQSPVAGQNPLDETLSLNPLDTNVSNPISPAYNTSAVTDGMNSPFDGAFGNYGFSDTMFADGLKGTTMTRTSSNQDDSVATSDGGGADWTSFLRSFDDTKSGNVSA